jgi:hypothetical protein
LSLAQLLEDAIEARRDFLLDGDAREIELASYKPSKGDIASFQPAIAVAEPKVERKRLVHFKWGVCEVIREFVEDGIEKAEVEHAGARRVVYRKTLKAY